VCGSETSVLTKICGPMQENDVNSDNRTLEVLDWTHRALDRKLRKKLL
jgi:hypothetical protein